MATTALTAENFESTVTDNEIVLVDFWADWCGPCKRFSPIYEDASVRHDGVVFAKVDTEDARAKYYYEVANEEDAVRLLAGLRASSDPERAGSAVEFLRSRFSVGPVRVALPMRRIIAIK